MIGTEESESALSIACLHIRRETAVSSQSLKKRICISGSTRCFGGRPVPTCLPIGWSGWSRLVSSGQLGERGMRAYLRRVRAITLQLACIISPRPGLTATTTCWQQDVCGTVLCCFGTRRLWGHLPSSSWLAGFASGLEGCLCHSRSSHLSILSRCSVAATGVWMPSFLESVGSGRSSSPDFEYVHPPFSFLRTALTCYAPPVLSPFFLGQGGMADRRSLLAGLVA